jgi:hypothetical protein
MGVPARGGVPADKPTGLKTSELRAGAGSVAKAAAYVNQQMVEETTSKVEELLKQLDELTQATLAPGEESTWPEMTDQMKNVLRTEQQYSSSMGIKGLNELSRTVVAVLGKESILVRGLQDSIKPRVGELRLISPDATGEAAAASGLDVLVIASDTEGSFLSFGGGSGSGGPDVKLVESLISASHESLKHVVYVSSLGADKVGFQFRLDQAALEKKKAVEQSVRRLSKAYGYSYSIIRIGNLVQPKAGEDAFLLEPGDTLQGSTSTRTVQDAVLQCLALPATMPAALNASFAVVTTRGKAATDDEWKDQLLKLIGPELERIPLKHVDVQDARKAIRAWALQFMEGSRKLTTPAFAVRTPVGAKIYFIPPTNRLSTSFKEDKAIERAKQKGDPMPKASQDNRPVLEGGLEVCIDDTPVKRARVRRVAVEENTVIKAMSERDLLNSLKEELQKLEQSAASR